MTDWLEHSVQVEVPTPVEHVWSLWSNLEQMPHWMKWIHSVTLSETDPSLSVWEMKANSFSFNWRSRILKLQPLQLIQWESVDGLPNRGAIRFYDRKDNSIVKLTVAYGVPGILVPLMATLSVGSVVESSLKADLERFRDYAIQDYKASQTTPESSEQPPG
ncbi:MAG: hypothetical protein HC824_00985 [Synechococcales cyanobacterium RM1_1_8]|nr:hypothetical protein [Synechococcales cyanobacterium RM1_1_8]